MQYTRKITTLIVIALSFSFAYTSLASPRTSNKPPNVSKKTTSLATPDKEHIEILHELVSYLYRWVLDEIEVQSISKIKDFEFWIQDVTPADMDEADNSRFISVWMPQLHLKIELKRSDYAIPELSIDLKSDSYKITSILRLNPAQKVTKPKGCKAEQTSMKELRDYVFKMRNKCWFPSLELRQKKMGPEARKQAAIAFAGANRELPKGKQTIYMAPMSPISNEFWFYWSDGKMLFHVTSDGDLLKPATWDSGNLRVSNFDVLEQTVVSLDEVPGSNAYMTRDQVGRALYNCMILGLVQKVDEVKPHQP